MPSGPAAFARRPLLMISTIAVLVLVVLVAVVGVLALRGRDDSVAGVWTPASGATGRPSETLSEETVPASPTISFSATGDIIFGNAGSLPRDDGAGFFAGVVDALAADVVMGNLEQPLTDDTDYAKCAEDSDACHAFRAPPHYAAHLRDAGFSLLNLANNHGNDYGPQGRANTQATLTEHGLAHTGERDQITMVEVEGASVAVLGFSPYSWTNTLLDLTQASAMVSEAADQADLVLVQAHMGAEGSDQTRVRPGEEIYYDENRGDPMAFARAVIDAGADLVIGHGPHVLRGLEFYQGKLIAYSLGNFAGGGGTLRTDGPLGLGAVLKVSLHVDGTFAEGRLISTHMYDAGVPQVDPEQRSLALVREVTALDFPETGVQLDRDGVIVPDVP